MTASKIVAAAASGVGGEVLDIDEVFSTYLYEGNGTAQNINNGINIGDNIAGSVDFDGTGDSLETQAHSFGYGTADFTVEFWMYADTLSTLANIFDNRSGGSTGFMIGVDASQKIRFYYNSANLIIDSNTISTGAWHHIAVARSSGTTKMFKNGTQIGSDYSDSNNYTSSWLEIGQRSTSDGLEFDGKLSNVRVVLGTALYTANFDVPTAPLTAISGTELLICTANNFLDEGPNSISFTVKGNPQVSSSSPFTGNTGEGGLLWTKARNVAFGHNLFDTERGFGTTYAYRIFTNETNAQSELTDGVSSFNSNGFSVGNSSIVNGSSYNYASWTFRKAPKFFDVVTWTGNGASPRNISHSLGSQPGMMIVKRTSSVEDWTVYHRSLGATKYLQLNGTQGEQTFNQIWADTEPTSTQFTVGNTARVNTSGETYVAYLFAHNNSDGEFGPDSDQDIIKCGSYAGNSTDARTINLGFEAQWLLVKRSDGQTDWWIVDNMRGLHARQVSGNYLEANTGNAEASQGNFFADSQGFMVDAGDYNTSGENYIYMAIRRGPLAEPESATDVFGAEVGGSSGSTLVPEYTPGFSVDMAIAKSQSGSSGEIYSRLTQGRYLNTNDTSAEASNGNAVFDYQDGYFSGGSTWFSWMWKRAPSFFDVVAYSGTGSARTVNHNLGAVPEMIWVKRRNTINNWKTFHSSLGGTKSMELNTTVAAETNGSALWNSTAPTASVFSLGTASDVNGSGSTYIAYLFATLAGVSKVGSFSHTSGQTQNIDCGFSSGARFVLVKQYGGTGNWFVYDTARGIVAGNDPRLQLNTTAAENTANDDIDPLSSGFTLTTNFSGGDYIFYAIA